MVTWFRITYKKGNKKHVAIVSKPNYEKKKWGAGVLKSAALSDCTVKTVEVRQQVSHSSISYLQLPIYIPNHLSIEKSPYTTWATVATLTQGCEQEGRRRQAPRRPDAEEMSLFPRSIPTGDLSLTLPMRLRLHSFPSAMDWMLCPPKCHVEIPMWQYLGVRTLGSH